MLEKTLERKLVARVEKVGGLALKLTSPGFAGLPDRIILLPAGRIVFIEVKHSGRKLRPLQEARHEQLRQLGFKVFVLDDERQIAEVMPK